MISRIYNGFADKEKSKGEIGIMKTFIAVEQQELLENIKFNLEKTNKFEIIGTATNGTECLNFFNQRNCDLLIIDLMLSEIDGLGILNRLKEIHKNSSVEIESFVHGALCYCYSGQCFMSSFIGGRSGNRGQCAQPCRMEYNVLNCSHNKQLHISTFHNTG